MTPHAEAICQVLHRVDRQYKKDTITVDRLRCMQKLCDDHKIPIVPHPGNGPRYHDFNTLYKVTERTMRTSANRNAVLWSRTLPGGLPMEKMFLAGSEVFTPAFLQAIQYTPGEDSPGGVAKHTPSIAPSSSSDEPTNEAAVSGPSGVTVGGKRKRERKWLNFPRALKRPRIIASSPCLLPQNADAPERHSTLIAKQMIAIRTSIEELTKLILPTDQLSQLAAPALAPTSALEALYQHTLGSESWKVTAVELQAADALDAESYLQALIWSFLHKFVLATCDFWEQHIHNMKVSLQQDTDLNEAGQAKAYRENIRAQLPDSLFWEAEIVPEAHRLAHELQSTLAGHIDQLGRSNDKLDEARRDFDRGLQAVCAKALLLSGHLEVSGRKYSFLLHRFDVHGRQFNEEIMEDEGGLQNDQVAFTVMPGVMWRASNNENWKLLVKAKVRTI